MPGPAKGIPACAVAAAPTTRRLDEPPSALENLVRSRSRHLARSTVRHLDAAVLFVGIAAPTLLACHGAGSAHPDELVGSWHDASGMRMVLNDDGTGAMVSRDSLAATWSVRGDTLRQLCVGQEREVGADCERYSVSGNTLAWGAHILQRD